MSKPEFTHLELIQLLSAAGLALEHSEACDESVVAWEALQTAKEKLEAYESSIVTHYPPRIHEWDE